jgi:hypothetical protein
MQWDKWIRDIAAASADYHEQQFCSFMEPTRRAEIWSVVYDLCLSSMEALRGLVEARHARVPIAFSAN